MGHAADHPRLKGRKKKKKKTPAENGGVGWNKMVRKN